MTTPGTFRAVWRGRTFRFPGDATVWTKGEWAYATTASDARRYVAPNTVVIGVAS